MGVSAMNVSLPFLGFGLVLMGLGVILVLLSFSQQNGSRIKLRSIGVIFIGPIPILIGGRSRWTFVALTAAALIFILFLAFTARPILTNG